MSLGEDEYDKLAHDLSQSDFDAVERNGYRAEWTQAGEAIVVRELGTDEHREYDGEDLIRSTSDREVSNARIPDSNLE